MVQKNKNIPQWDDRFNDQIKRLICNFLNYRQIHATSTLLLNKQLLELAQ